MELLAKLGVDWRLLIAQIVNFTILLSVLTLFVYRPLLRVIDERRERIRKSMEDADAIAHEKEKIAQARQEALRKIDQECGAFLEKAKNDAERMKADILHTTDIEVKNLLTKGREQLRSERAQALQEMQKSLSSAILQMTEKILEREFSPRDQERVLTQIERSLPSLLV
ncbi:F0F1 ATP synthase subunit B [Candidatus Peregrinibacteria bacterium]|nr:F0F1 ATP synthase subunit B [Candidatus Peregrinibacteria bacterium]